MFSSIAVGDNLQVRIKEVRDDGKLILSLREQAHVEIENDAQKIIIKLKENDGELNLNDKSSPELIKKEFNISKSSFKQSEDF